MDIEQLKNYGDDKFLKELYKKVLHRRVDKEGYNFYINKLRSGELNKTDIIFAILSSQEAKQKGTQIKLSNIDYIKIKLFNLPIIGYISKILYAIFTLPNTLKKLNKYENFFLNIQENERKIEKVNKSYYLKYANSNDTEENVELKLLNNFYIEFENVFRGKREEVRHKLTVYLPYLDKLTIPKEEQIILDIGCGRGEWLELLRDSGYKAKGIDISDAMIKISQELQLIVQREDALSYLKRQPDNSLTAITGFHIIEHLPFTSLLQLYKEVYRVLQVGGIAIFETPNPQNVFVGTSNFYTDPTHKNPIPPQTSKFTLEFLGFKDVHIKGVQETDIKYDDANINHLFASPIDYAVIGYKK